MSVCAEVQIQTLRCSWWPLNVCNGPNTAQRCNMDDIDALELVGWGTPQPPARHLEEEGPAPRPLIAASQGVLASQKRLFSPAPSRSQQDRRLPLHPAQYSQAHFNSFADSEVDLLTIDSDFVAPAVRDRPLVPGPTAAKRTFSPSSATAGDSVKRLQRSQPQQLTKQRVQTSHEPLSTTSAAQLSRQQPGVRLVTEQAVPVRSLPLPEVHCDALQVGPCWPSLF